jgi:hypothetical protein
MALTLSGVLAASVTSASVDINNGIAPEALGHFRVTLDDGGETRNVYVTAEKASDGGLIEDEIVYDYYTYIDLGEGNSVLRLGNTTVSEPVAMDGSGNAVSRGTFTGSNGNEIAWEAVSWIIPGEVTMQTRYHFQATSGTLGELTLHQYLDEDVNSSVSDDFLLRTGSADARDLQLFTLDGPERYGISHSGAFSRGQGLVNAEFIGWAADEYSDLKSRIQGGTVEVSRTGIINTTSLPAFIDDQFGQVFGPEDVTSTLSWKVAAGATEAYILTSLGGVPESSAINVNDSFTITYNRGVETLLEPYWENVRLYNYRTGEWMVWEDRVHEPGMPYEFTNLDGQSNYWLGSWNYTTQKWDTSVVIMVYDLIGPQQ